MKKVIEKCVSETGCRKNYLVSEWKSAYMATTHDVVSKLRKVGFRFKTEKACLPPDPEAVLEFRSRAWGLWAIALAQGDVIFSIDDISRIDSYTGDLDETANIKKFTVTYVPNKIPDTFVYVKCHKEWEYDLI